MPAKTNAKRVVILGSGFAGVYAYLGLHDRFHARERDIEVVLVSEFDYFLFLTLLQDVATGDLLPANITYPVRTLPSCCLDRFIEGNITKINLDTGEITIEERERLLPNGQSGETKKTELRYDYLISALGSETNFFDIPGANEFTYPLKNLEDAKRIKNRVIDSFEEADELTDENEIRNTLRFIIVGGGPTGVELAGELADYVNAELTRAYPFLKGKAEIILLEGGNRLVPQMDAWFDKKVCEILSDKLGVHVRYDAKVSDVTQMGVRIGEESILSRTVIWAAGVKARKVDFVSREPLAFEKMSERVKVNAHLSLPTHENIFIVGDQAWIVDKETGMPYPMRAQFATREGDLAAENVYNHLYGQPSTEFEWKDLGFIISLGKRGALAHVMGMRISGYPAWWLHRIAYLSKIIGIRTKMRTALEWTLNAFTPRDVTRL
ncbi:MAG: NADH dehydrogenase [Parcubacteria group bacterium Gr01-1014_48]|nr:MAG: NADH dehydrogenase [Parcubacteria group bacterium Greene0416_14]TSC74352.1 MAG: NADH dehydrogenase [Parcubacteria group bacterium Gr01-1014_48]TSD00731.1 MAG: NADH dehydrogenase [Parcubacteria group bacterium Greene1014_15]TSD07853.1 MAG: NADH dehydrogenase [Parcubacteria group bacterium Greene0714_4]